MRTVADLVLKFRSWVHQGEMPDDLVHVSARRSCAAQSKRRIRRELHHLRWLERGARARAARALRNEHVSSLRD